MVIVFVVYFFNAVYVPDISFIVAIAVAICIIMYIVDVKENDIGNLNKELHYKLVSLLQDENMKEPEYLYIYPDMINFFYDIRDFRIYNRDSYYKAIKSTDELLRIKKELENDYRYIQEGEMESWQNFGPIQKKTIANNIKNHKEMFEMAEVLGQRAINYIHSFAVTLPGGIYRKKYNKAFKKFHVLIKRVLDDILSVCKRGSRNPLVGQSYGLPKPSKKDMNASFDFVYM
jgi:hypothetical protein